MPGTQFHASTGATHEWQSPRYPRRTVRTEQERADRHHRHPRPGDLRRRPHPRRRQHPRHLHLPRHLDARGRRGDAREIRRHLRRRRLVRKRDRGRLRAVDEHRLRPVLPRLRAAELSRLSEDENPARRLRRLDGGRPADDDRGADAHAEDLPARFRRHGNPGRSAGHESGGRRSQHRQARHPRRRRVDRRLRRRPTARTSARARAASRARAGSSGTA